MSVKMECISWVAQWLKLEGHYRIHVIPERHVLHTGWQ